MLRSRFETELARQAAKAAKAAAHKSSSGKSARKRHGNGERAQPRARTSAPTNENQPATFLEPGLVPPPPFKAKFGKKKKRSALANASNPHHLRNYVPSRLPRSGPGGINQNTANSGDTLYPLPIKFLSADISPRRRKPNSPVQPPPTIQLTNPSEEWICVFCEYELFYGEEQEYRRAIRHRKKVLRRRRRAQERAAAAASGNSTLKKGSSRDEEEYEDEDPEFDPTVDEVAALPKQTKWKGDPDKDQAGGGESSYG